jgi:hypothetical protein
MNSSQTDCLEARIGQYVDSVEYCEALNWLKCLKGTNWVA